MMRFFLAMLVLLTAASALATPPRTLSYQGVLNDDQGDPVADGTYSMTFGIYGLPSGGTPHLSETQSVDVVGGNFNVVLGQFSALDDLPFDVPYWLGLSVDGDPEMTPRTPLTGTPYSLIARTVEAEAIEAEHIADLTVVRSINGFKDALNLIGSGDIDVSSVRETITISSTAVSPGVASAKGITPGTLSTSIGQLASRSINCPAPGYVLVIGSCDVFLSHNQGNPTFAEIGVSDEPSALASNTDNLVQIPFSSPTGTFTFPLTSQGIFTVNAGNNTFYLLGQRSSTGSASAGNRQLSLVYFEASYGTVSPLSLSDPFVEE